VSGYPATAWARSKRNNLWRRMRDGRTLTVFKRPGGEYAWCIAGERLRFSPGDYATETEALRAMLGEIYSTLFGGNNGRTTD
jgi:hypothetical protein